MIQKSMLPLVRSKVEGSEYNTNTISRGSQILAPLSDYLTPKEPQKEEKKDDGKITPMLAKGSATNPMPPIEIEKKEKIEEDLSNIEISVTSILSLEDDSLEYINKNISSNVYGYNRVNLEDLRNDRIIYFYELSDLNRIPLFFNKVDEFQKWAKQNNVEVSDYTATTIKGQAINFICCWKSSNYIAVKTSWEELDKSVNWQKYSGNSYYSQQTPAHRSSDYDYYGYGECDWD